MSGLANRRALLASGLAAAVFAASGLPVAAARRGGSLRVALPEAGVETVRARALGASLTELAPEGTLRAGLAERWESAADARLWRLGLRPEAPAEGVAAALGALGAVTVAGPGVLHLALETADANLPFRLAVLPVPGTGLYREDGSGRLVRVAQHWKDGRAGWFDTVELVARDPAEARLATLRSGRVDAAAALGGHAENMLRAAGEHAVTRTGAGLDAVSLRVAAPVPMTDPLFVERWSLA